MYNKHILNRKLLSNGVDANKAIIAVIFIINVLGVNGPLVSIFILYKGVLGETFKSYYISETSRATTFLARTF